MMLTITIGFLWLPPQKPTKTEMPFVVFNEQGAETLMGSLTDLAFPTSKPPFKVPQKQKVEHQEPQAQDTDPVLQSDSHTTPAHVRNKEVIKQFLALAGESLKDYRLTVPVDNSALHFYRRVLELDPQNASALQGFKEIATRYAWLAEQAIERSQHVKAKRYIELGLLVDPHHPHLLALQERTGERALTHTLKTVKKKFLAEPEGAVWDLRGFQNK
jgi:hypothetical protein